jgi:ketol-acid reductoisomerase
MKRILKTEMRKGSFKDDEIKIILQNFLDTILNGNFSETCFLNLNTSFQDLLNYNTFNQNRKIIIK